MDSFRFAGSRRRFPPLLERANTVATGLGQTRRMEPGGVTGGSSGAREMAGLNKSSGGGRGGGGGGSNEVFRKFCRGSLKRLEGAESKVSVAKKDMEEIIQLAKLHRKPSSSEMKEQEVQSDTDLASPVTSPSASSSSCSANKRLPIASTNSHSSRKKSPTTIDLKCGDAAVRLAKDSRLAIEAHEEMCTIVSQFASLLQEEEARIAQRAENLQRRSSQVQFDLAAAAALQVQRQQDDAEEKDGDEQKDDANDDNDANGEASDEVS